MKSKSLTIIGYYGDNFGDLLMLNGLLQNIPDDYSKINILSYSSLLNEVDLDLNERNIEIYDLNAKGKIKTIRRALKSSNSILWGGGTCFNDIDGAGAIKTMLLAKLLGKKCIYFGVGVDTLKKRKSKIQLWFALLISSNFIIRDELSNKIISNCNFPLYKIFLSKKIKVVPDLAYLFLNSFKNRTSDEAQYDLLISYRNIEKYFSDHVIYLDNFINCMQTLILENNLKKIVIINSDKEVDESNSAYIEKMLKHTSYTIEYLSEISFLDKISVLNASKFTISGRLHVAFCAFYFKKPFLILNYSDKNKAFVTENQIDPNCLIDYEQLSNLNKFPKIIANNNSDNTIIDKINTITSLLKIVLK